MQTFAEMLRDGEDYNNSEDFRDFAEHMIELTRKVSGMMVSIYGQHAPFAAGQMLLEIMSKNGNYSDIPEDERHFHEIVMKSVLVDLQDYVQVNFTNE